jgi:ubiquitin C-terminal hydrolase
MSIINYILDTIDIINSYSKDNLEIKELDEFTIAKGGFTFKILERGKFGSRDSVVIEASNKNETKKYSYYRSHSEVGLWRACYFISYTGQLYKGVNYITASFVDIDIQNLINKKYDKLNTNETIDTYCSSDTLSNLLADRNRIVNDPIFNTLSRCKAGECFKSTWKIKNYIDRLQDTGYDYELKKLLCETDENCDNILNNDKKLLEQIKGMYKAISEFVEKYFEITSEPNYIGENTVTYKNESEQTKIIHNFFEIKIKNKVNNKEYKLIYSKYEFKKTSNSNFNGEYYTIINIVPAKENLTIFGLNYDIVSAGVYIYKILEYKEQCNIKDRDRSVSVDNKSCYIFIGDLMTNIFPFNKINGVELVQSKSSSNLPTQNLKIVQNKIPPGIPNVGNTCFHNSVAQLFYRMTEITNFITIDKIQNQYKKESPINSFIGLLKLMKNNNLDRASLNNLVMGNICPIIPIYNRGTQQDADELLNSLLRGLFPDCPDHYLNIDDPKICKKVNENIVISKKFPKNDPRNFFRFKKDYEFCETDLITDDLDKIDDVTLKRNLTSCNLFKKHKTIVEIILQYNPMEHKSQNISIGINNLIEPIITNNNNNIKKLFIIHYKVHDVSKYIFIHLESFKYDLHGNSTKKSHKVILDDIKLNNNTYKLVGIIYHIGTSINSGHYVANIKYDNKWYEFNDSIVTPLDSYDKNYLKGNGNKLPYIVLYERIDGNFPLINPNNVPNELNNYLEDI